MKEGEEVDKTPVAKVETKVEPKAKPKTEPETAGIKFESRKPLESSSASSKV
jgi:hypothetical protein